MIKNWRYYTSMYAAVCSTCTAYCTSYMRSYHITNVKNDTSSTHRFASSITFINSYLYVSLSLSLHACLQINVYITIIRNEVKWMEERMSLDKAIWGCLDEEKKEDCETIENYKNTTNTMMCCLQP